MKRLAFSTATRRAVERGIELAEDEHAKTVRTDHLLRGILQTEPRVRAVFNDLSTGLDDLVPRAGSEASPAYRPYRRWLLRPPPPFAEETWAVLIEALRRSESEGATRLGVHHLAFSLSWTWGTAAYQLLCERGVRSSDVRSHLSVS